jgi:hypothetical protein
MTEQEWLDCGDPDKLFFDRHSVVPRAERQLRLFACGCCRQIWSHIADERCRNAVIVGELEADGMVTEAQFNEALNMAEQACDAISADVPSTIEQTADYAALMALRAPSDVAVPVANVLARLSSPENLGAEVIAQLAFLATLFRDVFGNPFRAQNQDRGWVSPEITALAQTIYDSPQLPRYRQLSSYLERNRCTDQNIVAHCMYSNCHIKGCWVIDFILSKAR